MSQKSPWKTLNTRKIYDNPWISVEEHQVINPGGENSLYGKVSFKNYAIGIIPLDPQMNTWLVGQYRYTLEDYSWEIPMGGGPLNEEILISAKRELKEETGLVANDWEMILKIHTSNSVTDEEGFVFIARDLQTGSPNLEPTEKDLVVKKVSLEEAVDMVTRGDITDSLSVGGLLMADKKFL